MVGDLPGSPSVIPVQAIQRDSDAGFLSNFCRLQSVVLGVRNNSAPHCDFEGMKLARDILRSTALLTLGGLALLRASTVEDAIIAAMRLTEVSSYSWITQVSDDARSYTIEGMTQHGFTWQRQPMPENIARRLGRGAGYELEAIFSGPSNYVIRTEDGWKLLDELPKRHPDWADEGTWYFPTARGFRTPDMPADEATGIGFDHEDQFGLPAAIYVPVLKAAGKNQDGQPYSNAQFALGLPHEALSILVSSHTDLSVEGNVVTGTLSDLGAQLLLVHDGHEYIRPVIATGRFKLWLGEGLVHKYTVELAGLIVVDRKTVYVRQKSTTALKNIDATAFDLPTEALRRL